LPPSLARFIADKFNVEANSFLYLDMLYALDFVAFHLAKKKDNIIIITKDEDFVNLSILNGAPPFIIWITVGNISNSMLFEIIGQRFEEMLSALFNSQKSFIQFIAVSAKI